MLTNLSVAANNLAVVPTNLEVERDQPSFVRTFPSAWLFHPAFMTTLPWFDSNDRFAAAVLVRERALSGVSGGHDVAVVLDRPSTGKDIAGSHRELPLKCAISASARRGFPDKARPRLRLFMRYATMGAHEVAPRALRYRQLLGSVGTGGEASEPQLADGHWAHCERALAPLQKSGEPGLSFWLLSQTSAQPPADIGFMQAHCWHDVVCVALQMPVAVSQV